MIIPKVTKVKYRSVRKIPASSLRKIESGMQLSCYKGLYHFKCGTRYLCHSCWFCGLKPVKE